MLANFPMACCLPRDFHFATDQRSLWSGLVEDLAVLIPALRLIQVQALDTNILAILGRERRMVLAATTSLNIVSKKVQFFKFGVKYICRA